MQLQRRDNIRIGLKRFSLRKETPEGGLLNATGMFTYMILYSLFETKSSPPCHRPAGPEGRVFLTVQNYLNIITLIR